MRGWIKHKIYRWVGEAARKRAEQEGRIYGLCYHRFEKTPGADPKAGMAITPERFKMHLETLGELGTWITVDEAVRAEPGRGIRFFLTFDDGYQDNLTVLLPILEAMNIPCCIYPATGWLSGETEALEHDLDAGFKPPGLSSGELRALAEHALITLGAHTVRHARLAELSEDEVRRELRTSKAWLEEVAGESVRHFAYPFGTPDVMRWDRDRQLLSEAGYVSAASNHGGFVMGGSSNSPLELKRVPAPNTGDPEILAGWVFGMCDRSKTRLSRRGR